MQITLVSKQYIVVSSKGYFRGWNTSVHDGDPRNYPRWSKNAANAFFIDRQTDAIQQLALVARYYQWKKHPSAPLQLRTLPVKQIRSFEV